MSVHEIITDRVVARIEEAIKTGERFRWCKAGNLIYVRITLSWSEQTLIGARTLYHIQESYGLQKNLA